MTVVRHTSMIPSTDTDRELALVLIVVITYITIPAVVAMNASLRVLCVNWISSS